MEITEHQANMLRALADRKTLQFREILPEGSSSFAYEYANIYELGSALLFINSDKYEVRIKPDVIIVNGIEVPAPESVELQSGIAYYTPSVVLSELCGEAIWRGDEDDIQALKRGIVYLEKEAAVDRARAMLLHKRG